MRLSVSIHAAHHSFTIFYHRTFESRQSPSYPGITPVRVSREEVQRVPTRSTRAPIDDENGARVRPVSSQRSAHHSTKCVARHMPRLPIEILAVKALLKLNAASWKRFTLPARTVSSAGISSLALHECHCLDASWSAGLFVGMMFSGHAVMACTLEPLSESSGAMKVHATHRKPRVHVHVHVHVCQPCRLWMHKWMAWRPSAQDQQLRCAHACSNARVRVPCKRAAHLHASEKALGPAAACARERCREIACICA